MLRYLVLISILLQFFPVLGQQKAAKQFNIVLFIADDLGINDTSPYGNAIVRTPNLDRFNQQSMLFTKAFATSPTCGPSRSSIFTGLMPMRHGAHGNHSGVKEGTKSIVQYLNPLGYRVAIAGKLHVGPEDVFPFERISKTNVVEPGFEKNPGLHYDLNLEPVDKWLASQKKDKPFMLIAADHSPHVVWPENASYDPAKIDIPAKHIDTEDTRRSRARYYTDITKMDSNFGRLLQSLERHGLSENTIVVFTADQGPQWAFGKWNLYDYGIHTPLLVRWPGMVKQGARADALVSLVDLLPTFIEIGGGKAPAEIDGKSFLPVLTGKKDSHRDMVFATHTGDRLMNRSPARMLRTSQYKYILNLAPEISYHTHMDKAKDHDGGREYWDSWREMSFKNEHAGSVLWRYHNRPKEELYDIKTDPWELHNLAEEPAYTERLKDFRKKMEAKRKQQNDFADGPEKLDPVKPAKGQKPVAPYVFLD